MTFVRTKAHAYPYPPTSGELTEEHLSMPTATLTAIARHPVTVYPDTTALYHRLAREMADELRDNNLRGEPTRWILPVGPKAHYPLLARICNQERISWAEVHAFHMDEFLDWQGRPVEPSHPFSFRGYCDRNLYQLLDPALRPHPGNVVYPDVLDPDAYGARLREVGGADTCFAGFGYRGHLAFNEPPSSRWHRYTVEEFAASTTRIVTLLDDTLVALSHRLTGGYTQPIPPMAITLGMAEILSARRLHLITDGGAWKRYIVRVLLLTTEPEVSLPVTLAHRHPDVRVSVDADSIAPCAVGLGA
ncbi:6-phosphogluconolactonase [Streptosporangium sp. NPDC000509]|uniref:6-phosphogluconolactonase n=1 Tax=Streptosporangium sp. NPDC000509 TaxID=3366186 RepID=UPI00368A76DC